MTRIRPILTLFTVARLWAVAFLSVSTTVSQAKDSASAPDLREQVLIHRTEFGVPHILADHIKAAGFGMAWVQLEDYGTAVVNSLIRNRGEWAKYHTLTETRLEQQLLSDAAAKLRYQFAKETFGRLDVRTTELLEGYAAGVNRYIELYREEFPSWVQSNFTAVDVHAVSITSHSDESVKKFIEATRNKYRLLCAVEPFEEIYRISSWGKLALAQEDPDDHLDAGSNAWALAPSRTRNGHALLVRNPHLSWSSTYYEAHFVVKNQFDFYGDFRIGQPLGIVGGFNSYLGWTTTNNYTDNDEVYALALDPVRPHHYLLDGKSYPVQRIGVEVDYRDASGQIQTSSQYFESTEFGPVICTSDTHLFIIRSASAGSYRANEQFLTMMAATNLDEWKDGMRILGRGTSNFTYADREGQIFYVWNGAIPKISHPSGKDTSAVFVQKRAEIWSEIVPWDSLPQLLNPKGGYLRNENDPFHYTNLHHVFEASKYPDNMQAPMLRLRSQRSLELVGGDHIYDLESLLNAKHDVLSLLAVRVKNELIQLLEQHPGKPRSTWKRAINLLKKWDNTLDVEAAGGLLFEHWWNQYVKLVGRETGDRSVTPASAGYEAPGEALFEVPWSEQAPTTTPRGLGSPELAVEAFQWALEDCAKKFGAWDLPWGAVHRAVLNGSDYAISGGTGMLGIFRVLWYEKHQYDSKKRQVSGGDCLVWGVEFAEVPRGYSILAYGQSKRAHAKEYGDQLALFSKGQMKPIRFTEADILKHKIATYRPGLRR